MTAVPSGLLRSSPGGCAIRPGSILGPERRVFQGPRGADPDHLPRAPGVDGHRLAGGRTGVPVPSGDWARSWQAQVVRATAERAVRALPNCPHVRSVSGTYRGPAAPTPTRANRTVGPLPRDALSGEPEARCQENPPRPTGQGLASTRDLLWCSKARPGRVRADGRVAPFFTAPPGPGRLP